MVECDLICFTEVCVASVCCRSLCIVSVSGSDLPRCLLFCSGSGEDSLDRLLPHARAPRRKSTTSLSKTEPPLLRTGTRTIYTAGRPPWYDEHGAQSKEAFVIGMSVYLHAKLALWSAESFLLCNSLFMSINTLGQSLMRTTPQPYTHSENKTESVSLKCRVYLQGCVGVVPQGRPPWQIKSLRPWMCRGLCFCLWILSTRLAKHAGFLFFPLLLIMTQIEIHYSLEVPIPSLPANHVGDTTSI